MKFSNKREQRKSINTSRQMERTRQMHCTSGDDTPKVPYKATN